MAGFFGLFDFTKEGKGVYPDDPPKGPVGTFFSILGRKFWKIVTINMMYLLFSLPALALVLLGSNLFFNFLLPAHVPELINKLIAEDPAFATIMLFLYVILGLTVMGLSLIVVGPTHAGVTYLLRNYAREEHAFVWMDFKEHARSNWKQALLNSAVSLLLTLVLLYAFWFYGSSPMIGGIARVMLRTLIIVFLALWAMIQIYIYPMMITFNLKYKQLLRNCLLFAIMRLPINLLVLIGSLFILAVIPMVLILVIARQITFLIAILWYLLLAFGLNLFLTNFVAYRGIDKYMLSRLRAAEEPPEEAAEEEAEPDELDDAPEEESDEQDEDNELPEAYRRPGQGGRARAPGDSDDYERSPSTSPG